MQCGFTQIRHIIVIFHFFISLFLDERHSACYGPLQIRNPFVDLVG